MVVWTSETMWKNCFLTIITTPYPLSFPANFSLVFLWIPFPTIFPVIIFQLTFCTQHWSLMLSEIHHYKFILLDLKASYFQEYFTKNAIFSWRRNSLENPTYREWDQKIRHNITYRKESQMWPHSLLCLWFCDHQKPTIKPILLPTYFYLNMYNV